LKLGGNFFVFAEIAALGASPAHIEIPSLDKPRARELGSGM